MTDWLHRIYAAVILAGVVLCCLFVKSAADEIRSAAAEITATTRSPREAAKMTTTTWTSAQGTKTHTSNQRDDETFAEFVDRHDEEVATAQVKWPIV